MPNVLRKHRKEIVILAIAVSVRFLALFAMAVFGDIATLHLSDSSAYTDLAGAIAAGDGYSRDGGATPFALRVPGYPFYLSLSLYLFDNFWPALIGQIILASLIPFFLFRIALLLEFTPRIAFFASLFSALEPHLIIYSITFMSDVLFTFILLLSFLFFFKFFKGGRFLFLALSGGLLGLSAYVRELSLYLTLPYGIVIFYYVWKQEGVFLWRAVLSLGLFPRVFFIIVMPWFIRNYYHFGIVSFSFHGADALYLYTGSSIVALRDGISFDQAKGELIEEYEQETGTKISYYETDIRYNEVMYRKSFELITRNIPVVLKLAILSQIAFWTSHNYAYFLTYFYEILEPPVYSSPPTHLLFQGRIREALNNVSSNFLSPYYTLSIVGKLTQITIVMLMTAGFFYCLRKADLYRRTVFLFLLFLFFYYSAIVFTAGLGVEARYRYPIEPLMILMAVYGLCALLSRQNNKYPTISQSCYQ